MGIVFPGNWHANWISGHDDSLQSLLLRREFPIKPGVKRAIAHVSGLGHYEMSLNGHRVGEAILTPGWTNYRAAVLYDTYDVTSFLLPGGNNAVGLILGNGMYRVEKTHGRYNKFTGSFGPQQALVQIQIDYVDGFTELIVTNESWQTHPGPITYSDIYGGEDFDARLSLRGWDIPCSTTEGWSNAKVVGGPGGVLKGLSHASPPILFFDVLKPIAKNEIKLGVTVYDMGQNAACVPRLSVSGSRGSGIKITPAELVMSSGDIDDTMCGGLSYYTYVLAGDGVERWVPRFFYSGSRYFRVEQIPSIPGGELPSVESIEASILHSNSPSVGVFHTSDTLLNRIHTLVNWAQLSNMMSVLTDCPHREKLGWLEQYYLNGPALRYSFDVNALFKKVLNDIEEAQLPNGLIPSIAPEYIAFGGEERNCFGDSPEWGSALILAGWQQYLFSGDKASLEHHYQAMQRYIAYLGTRAEMHIVDYGLGDWYDIGPMPSGEVQLTPCALTATAIYYYDVSMLARIATALGRLGEARYFETLAHEICDAFNEKFLNSDTGTYSTNSQTANSLPLALGLVPSCSRASVLNAIVKDVYRRGVTTGDIGFRYLLRALADNGRSDVIFDTIKNSERPGYAYQLEKGATSLTEAWDANRTCSQNHFMLGQITEWFYHDLAGIQPIPSAPGFRQFIIKPAVVGDIKGVTARYDSVSGLICSSWLREGSVLTLNITIPPNTSATIYVPTVDPSTVLESDHLANSALGLTFIQFDNGAAVFAADSGNYRFTASLDILEK